MPLSFWLFAALVALISPAPVSGQEHPATTPLFGSPIRLGTITDPALPEISGVALGRLEPQTLWVHNDSGDRPMLYQIGRDGSLLRSVRVQGAWALDWEDLGPFSWQGRPHLLIADTGDNLQLRPWVQLYAVPEPQPDEAAVEPTWVLQVRFETGPVDCEAVVVDPTTGQILLITKRVSRDTKGTLIPPGVYQVPLPTGRPRAPVLARRIATTHRTATSADLCPAGRRLVLCSTEKGWLYERDPSETWQDALQRPPVMIPLPAQRQREALCFDHDGRSLLLLSEGLQEPIWQLPAPTQ